MPRIWPGYLAVWAAVALHMSWIVLLLVPHTHAFNATPVHEVYALSGFSAWRTVALLGVVAGAALVGLTRDIAPGLKLVCMLPQQLVLGISAAGAILAIVHSQYADGVPRPITFIAADQLAVILTWLAHTIAMLMLYLIHTHKLSAAGRPLPVDNG